MEVRIEEIKELKPIDFNYIEIKEELKGKLSVYKNAEYTEDTIKEAKDDRAKLNKLAKALNDRKIEIKKQVLKPLEDFEGKIKELIGMVDEANLNIDTQVKNFEEKSKSNKLQQIVEYFESNAGDMLYILNFDTIFNEKWLNTTYKIKDVENEIKTVVEKTRKDLNVINDLKSEFETELKDYYIRTLDITATLAEKTRLDEQKKKFAELESEKVKNTKVVEVNGVKVAETKTVDITDKKEHLQEIDFTVFVNDLQRELIGNFLNNNGIKYKVKEWRK